MKPGETKTIEPPPGEDNSEAQMDSALDTVMGGGGEDEFSFDGPADDGDEYAGSELTDPASLINNDYVPLPDPDDDGPEDTETETPAEESAGTSRSEEAENAYRNLELAGLSKSFLDGATDDQLVESWTGNRNQREGGDRAIRENAELRKRLEALEATVSPSEPAAPTEVPDFVMPEGLSEEIGTENAKALSKAFTEQLRTATAANQKPLLDRLEKVEGRADQVFVDQVMGDSRARVMEDIPGLKDSSTFKKVSEMAIQLLRAGVHENVPDENARLDAIMKLSAQTVAPTSIKEVKTSEQIAAEKQTARQRRNGEPMSGSRRPPKAKPTNQEQRMDAALDRIPTLKMG